MKAIAVHLDMREELLQSVRRELSEFLSSEVNIFLGGLEQDIKQLEQVWMGGVESGEFSSYKTM
jgi:hypothetical protein